MIQREDGSIPERFSLWRVARLNGVPWYAFRLSGVVNANVLVVTVTKSQE